MIFTDLPAGASVFVDSNTLLYHLMVLLLSSFSSGTRLAACVIILLKFRYLGGPGSMAEKQTILQRWGISAEELTDAIDANPSLRGMLLGYVAEFHLCKMWFQGRRSVSHFIKYDDHDRKKKGDLVVTYKRHSFKIECKSLQTNSIRLSESTFVGKAQCDASDRRTVKFADGSTLETTCLLAGEFDILAVNLFAFENKWRFIFAKNTDLPRSKFKRYTEEQRSQLLASLVPVSWPPQPPFREEPFGLMDEILRISSASTSSPSES